MQNITKQVDPEQDNWRGYTLNELRYRRAYVQVKLEMERAKLFNKSQNMMNEGMIPISGASKNIMGKVMGALDYFDYAFIAYKTGSKLIHIIKSLRPRRKRK